MPSKESLDKARKFNSHTYGLVEHNCDCWHCAAVADLLDEAIREARRETKIATMVSAIYVVGTYADSITSPFCKEKVAIADSMIEAARMIEKELRERLAQLEKR